MSDNPYREPEKGTTEYMRHIWAFYTGQGEEFDRWLAGVLEAERERCARVAERVYPLGSRVLGDAPVNIARAIRRLSNEEGTTKAKAQEIRYAMGLRTIEEAQVHLREAPNDVGAP